MAIGIVPSGAPIGAEITGVDLSGPLDDATFGEVEAAVHRYGEVYFRGQRLTPQQQRDFARRFGELEVHVMSQFQVPDCPELIIVSNVLENGKPIGFVEAGQFWHTDSCFRRVPSRCSLLYALEVPEQDGRVLGDTLFADAASAYDSLPDAMRRRIDGLKVAQRYGDRYEKTRGNTGGAIAPMTEQQKSKLPDALHPVVRVHPFTGRKCLYVNEGYSVAIDGLPGEESRALIAELTATVVRPEFVYRHVWRAGDLIIWDNCSTQHKAEGGYAWPLRRRMHRATVAGLPTS